jgi:hypothetical protein
VDAGIEVPAEAAKPAARAAEPQATQPPAAGDRQTLDELRKAKDRAARRREWK